VFSPLTPKPKRTSFHTLRGEGLCGHPVSKVFSGDLLMADTGSTGFSTDPDRYRLRESIDD
jgi:hypothetical protein